jgi:outer membrane protein TolC
MTRPYVFVALLFAFVQSGCASLSIDRNISDGVALAHEKESVAPTLRWSDAQRDRARAEVDKLLESPLSVDDAARISVAFSRSFQEMLFESSARSAGATQSARLPNPIFTFEHLIRRQDGNVDKDINRMLSFSVFDVLLLPARLRGADYQQQQLRIGIAGDIVEAAARARQAWVRAVAAQQAANYAEQVRTAADAGADLARRMQQVGNFSKLQRAREQAFYADAVAQLARARQAAASGREELIRTLGLDAEQAQRLTLPDRLPDPPPTPEDESALARTALEERLDVRMARAELAYLAEQQGLTRITSYVDGLQIAGERNSQSGKSPQTGYLLDMPLPIFDFGDARRAQAAAAYMAALNRTAGVGARATSEVRESYSAYRTAFDIARHYRDEIVPLRKSIADETLLQYNGMLIGVFELLADSREQIGSVIQAIEAQRDFWLADAALRANLIGRPLGAAPMEMKTGSAVVGGARH